MPNKPNDTVILDRCIRRLNALKQYVDPAREIAVNGRVGTAGDLVATYEAVLHARSLLAQKRSEVKAALAASAKLESALQDADRALKAWAVQYFGANSAQAHDFGFPPPRVPTITTEAKLLAVARGKATREARHTMGKRQKLKIRGVVPDASQTPMQTEAPQGKEGAP